MAKKPNAWMAHVMRTKAANLGMQLKDVLRKAAETYKKDASSSSSASSTKHKTHKKHGGLLLPSLFGGSRMSGGGSLSPADVKSSGGQLNTTQYSGGKKSRRKSSRKSSRKCKSKSKKSSRTSSHKRRGGNMLEGM